MLFNKMIKKLKGYRFRYYNFRLVIFAVALSILGIFAISSATDSDVYSNRQVFGLVAGIIIMFIVSLIDYKFILKFAWIIYILNLLLLLSVRLFGTEAGGAKRWVVVGGIQLQPSELAKILLILFFAWYLNRREHKINSFVTIISAVVFAIVPVFLILKQPDLSTAIVVIATFCIIMFISDLNMKIIGGIVAVAIPCAAVLIYLILQPDQQILEEYQYNRIIGFYDENNEVAEQIRYQQENSILAIGSGGLYGKGLNNNTVTSVKNGNFLSEPHTDFIFTIVGEEMGFIGAMAVVILLFLIVLECFINGAHAPDLSGRIVGTSFGGMIGVQAMINLAVVTMLIPNTGLTLPFVSYGLSSLMSLFLGIGIVLNIGIQRDIADID